ncbi:MAG TPA: magnesium-transporting ATPase [Ruminococcaceae bacterium]|nr:magnesium-transporting ATPase [Oscillospiraceae bacterium]
MESMNYTQNVPQRFVSYGEGGPLSGLTSVQVQQRRQAGMSNIQPQGMTPSTGKIIRNNVCTLFNLINLILAVAILLVGHPENILFLGIAVCNTLMGIIQELRAKRTLDRLAILSKSTVQVVRDGCTVKIDQEDIVLDDVMLVSTGSQICADGTVLLSEGMEADESLLTGESDKIRKEKGSQVLSGSFVTAGRAYVKVTSVGRDSYATKLTMEAKKEKKSKSPLMRNLQNIIRVLTFVIIPLGGILFYSQYTNSGDLRASVLGASAAMLGMIPEGLIMLTGITLTLGALKLARHKAMVQSLGSIETLARVDVLCLDKTGTITDGTLSFEKLVPVNDTSHDYAGRIISELMGALRDDNATAKALRETFGSGCEWIPARTVPFSSDRKWSGVSYENEGSFILGAPGSVFKKEEHEELFEAVRQYAAKGFRVLCLAHSGAIMEDVVLPEELSCLSLIILSDTVRAEAPETFRYFAGEGVTLKVISGDDPLTVSTVAEKAGIADSDRYIDMSHFDEQADYGELAKAYTVFGRVSPGQKRELVKALKEAGHTVCMTGDGVNDVPAMKEADCSVAMIAGSDAARGASDFVLMTSDFSAMVRVLREGRQVINNIETVASLYLVKTIFSALLSLVYIFIPYPYPFAPLQMTPINFLTVGAPSFFLALRKNIKKPEGKFLENVLEYALPAAVTVVLSILVVQLAGIFFNLSQGEISTMNVILTGAVGFAVLWRVARPLTGVIRAMLLGLMLAFVLMFMIVGDFFMLESLFTRNVFFYLPLVCMGSFLMDIFGKAVKSSEKLIGKIRWCRHKI